MKGKEIYIKKENQELLPMKLGMRLLLLGEVT